MSSEECSKHLNGMWQRPSWCWHSRWTMETNSEFVTPHLCERIIISESNQSQVKQWNPSKHCNADIKFNRGFGINVSSVESGGTSIFTTKLDESPVEDT